MGPVARRTDRAVSAVASPAAVSAIAVAVGRRGGVSGAGTGAVDAGGRKEERRHHEAENGDGDERELSGVDRTAGVVTAAGHGRHLGSVRGDTVILDR